MNPPLLAMSDIVKIFPGVRALGGVDLEVRAGEVHCLLGQNGAGKSTLIKILAGAQQPDEGTIRWQGAEVRLATPVAAIRLGVATIYQELDLVDGLSVAENIFLGHERSSLGFVRRGDTYAAAAGLLERLGHSEIPARREVGRLSAAAKQIVSMARALSRDARMIVMDEPSAVLAADEVDNLFRVIRELAARDVAILYISHRLAEIREIGDRVTVLREGHTAASGIDAKNTPTSQIVSLMTGRSIENAFPPRRSRTATEKTSDPGDLLGPADPLNPLNPLNPLDPADRSEPEPERNEVLRVEGLTRHGEFTDISFTLRGGEVLGLAGLVGSGRSEILETIYGARRADSGRVLFEGRVLRPGTVSAAVSRGMGLAPEERKSQALFLDHSITQNVSVASLSRYSRLGWLDRRRERDDATRLIRTLDLRPAAPQRLARLLSGGNQQKAVLARWLLRECRLLLLDEPTRGVDIGARAELYALIRQLADAGLGVLLVSSEIPEVLGLADRVLVLREGRVVREADAEALDERSVLDLVMEGGAVV
ncbi:sugar ABC transporter ATP-binding protein [Parafrankia elaeagni]|uniref:sugar ABC transporter ATP-binding protein n=1 Tax=Parafrankia elaeagni TaxID=222534 RepID=UPI00035D7205|nr:sugar ABC transporter ATP-binding protein [Parafrankia elaeagni]